MEKSYEMEKTITTESKANNIQNMDVEKTFQITKDVIEECLEPCIG